MSSLFNIGENFKNLYELANEVEYDEDGALVDNTKMLTELFEELEDSLSTKADATQYIIKELKSNALLLKDEELRLSKRRKSLENKAEYLKGLILNAMNKAGEINLKGKFSFNIRKYETLEIADDKAVPSDYIEFTKKINKVELKKDIKNGKIEATDGYFIKRNETLGVR